ncbi:MAG: M67 family metallopeptidase [Rubrobacter sp.]|nr:M67 family metallopeptidase [Rubrobacter sp.]MDQ3638048.1 M67 family metallopeptidase [Actinomycetota bacterium]
MIVIPEELLEAVVAHARREAPNEVCGWLAGGRNEVKLVYPVPNIAGDPRVGFRMDPEVQLSTMREIRELGLELTGTYHSHPRTPAAPSARDGGLAAYPEAMHLIVSLAAPEPEVRCYRIEEPFAAVEATVGPPARRDGILRSQVHPRGNCCRLAEERVGSSRARGS